MSGRPLDDRLEAEVLCPLDQIQRTNAITDWKTRVLRDRWVSARRTESQRSKRWGVTRRRLPLCRWGLGGLLRRMMARVGSAGHALLPFGMGGRRFVNAVRWCFAPPHDGAMTRRVNGLRLKRCLTRMMRGVGRCGLGSGVGERVVDLHATGMRRDGGVGLGRSRTRQTAREIRSRSVGRTDRRWRAALADVLVRRGVW